MSIVIRTNMASINGARHLNRAGKSNHQTTERMSSGLRINRAADDAANSAVTTNLEVTSRGAKQAMRNINDAFSVLNIAEEATNTAANSVKRMRELAVMSASETLSSTERQYAQAEYEGLVETVDDLANITQFNGKQLIDGNTPTLSIQAGGNNTADDRVTMTMGDISTMTIGVDTGNIDISTATGARDAIDKLDTALDTLNSYRSTYGGTSRRLSSALTSQELYAEEMESAESRLLDADFAHESSELSRSSIMMQAGTSILAQGSQLTQGVLSLL